MSKYLQSDPYFPTPTLAVANPCRGDQKPTLAGVGDPSVAPQPDAEPLANVYDLPATMMKRYVLAALASQYDPTRHTAASTEADYFVWLKVCRPQEFMKFLHKFMPQYTFDTEIGNQPVHFILSTPVKVIDQEDANLPMSTDPLTNSIPKAERN